MRNNHFIVSVECAIQCQEKLLAIKRPLGKHGGGMLAFPGGSVEVSDSQAEDVLQEAAKREVFEEVGIELNQFLTYINSQLFTDSKSNQVVINVFFWVGLEEFPEVVPSSREVPEWYWLSPQEVVSHSHCPPWMKHYVECIMNKQPWN